MGGLGLPVHPLSYGTVRTLNLLCESQSHWVITGVKLQYSIEN